MTARDAWEALLVEQNKVQAPPLLIEDFNYFINKTIIQYINKKYTYYDLNQQLADDLRVLKTTVHIAPSICNISGTNGEQKAAIQALYGSTYDLYLPLDYLHLLSCVCSFKYVGSQKYDLCGTSTTSTYKQAAATRLSTDLWPTVINNYYTRPSINRPYYLINNFNSNLGSVNSGDAAYKSTTDLALNTLDKSLTNSSKYSREIVLGGGSQLVGDLKQEIGKNSNEGTSNLTRVGSPENVRLEIRYGTDSNDYQLVDVQVDYLRAPQYIQLTQTQLDLIEDTSQILEWPDYVCDQIINELINLIFENHSDPRLQTHAPITQSIS